MTDDEYETTGVLRWERPPAPGLTGGGGRRRPWPVVAADLRKNPGEWGVVLEDGGTNSGTTVARINNASTRWFKPAGAFYAVQRQVEGQVTVYAVYIGVNHEYAEKAGIAAILRAA